MPAIVLVGAQWGDEGKGKATDLLGSGVDYVVKFNGGNNAGHTVVIERREVRAAPAARPASSPRTCTPVIGNGVVIDLAVLFEEIDGLEARGVDTSALLVSANAHIIPPLQPDPRQGDRALPRQPARSAPPGAASARPTPTR